MDCKHDSYHSDSRRLVHYTLVDIHWLTNHGALRNTSADYCFPFLQYKLSNDEITTRWAVRVSDSWESVLNTASGQRRKILQVDFLFLQSLKSIPGNSFSNPGNQIQFFNHLNGYPIIWDVKQAFWRFENTYNFFRFFCLLKWAVADTVSKLTTMR